MWGQETGSCWGAWGGAPLSPVRITSGETQAEAHREGKAGVYPSQGNTAPCNPHASSLTSTELGMWMPWEPDTLAPSPEAEVANGLKRAWSGRLGTKVSLTPPIFPPELSCQVVKEEADAGESEPCR